MSSLFIDLASNSQLIAIVGDDRVLASAKIESRTAEQQLLPLIDQLLKESKCTYKDISRIAATTGPGGFMSLRVGLSLANALADSLNIPIAGMHLSEMCEAKIRNTKPEIRNFLWVHSTKQNLLFIRGFGELEKEWPEPALISLEELNKKLETKNQKPIFYTGELIDSQQLALPFLKPIKDIAPLEEILPALLRNLPYEKKLLLPWYGRGA